MSDNYLLQATNYTKFLRAIKYAACGNRQKNNCLFHNNSLPLMCITKVGLKVNRNERSCALGKGAISSFPGYTMQNARAICIHMNFWIQPVLISSPSRRRNLARVSYNFITKLHYFCIAVAPLHFRNDAGVRNNVVQIKLTSTVTNSGDIFEVMKVESQHVKCIPCGCYVTELWNKQERKSMPTQV